MIDSRSRRPLNEPARSATSPIDLRRFGMRARIPILKFSAGSGERSRPTRRPYGNATDRSRNDEVAQVPKPGAPFEIVDREIPKPKANEVLIKVNACGVCHSDQLTKEGAWPGIQYPRIPGHEVGACLHEAGPGVTGWKVGQRVGVGWHGGHDGTCQYCRRGDFMNCENHKNLRHQLRRRLSGIHDRTAGSADRDSGHARRCVTPRRYCARASRRSTR